MFEILESLSGYPLAFIEAAIILLILLWIKWEYKKDKERGEREGPF